MICYSSTLRLASPDRDDKDYHKIHFDDESYHQGHGHAYDTYGIDPRAGAICIVRPDQCLSTLSISVSVAIC